MNPTRRTILAGASSVAAAAMFNSPASGQSTTRTVAATKAATTRANGKPNLAVIGCGGMGGFHGTYIGKYVNVVALADVDKNHLDTYNHNVAGGKAFVTGDYRQVLERADVDLVLVATPDHWHTKITADALRAGKDVYCEKPLTLTIDEGRFLCRIVRETSRVLQVGTQQRSEDRFLTAIALAQSGRLGRIRHVSVVIGDTPAAQGLKVAPVPPALDWNTWQGQTPVVDYIPERCHNNFRWWYEYSGGRMTDWGAHHVDIAQAAAAPDMPGPMTIDPAGVELPVPFEHGYPTVHNGFNTATKFQVTCKFANGVEILIADKVDHFPAENGIMILGDAGSLYVDRERIVGAAADALKTNPLPPGAIRTMPPGSPGQPHERHFVNFLQCVRDRAHKLDSDVFEHHRTLTTCHLANIAMRLGRKIHWDASAQQIVGDDEANALQSRAQRKGFEVV